MLQQAVKEFCASTALHGYIFLVTPKRFLFERIIWTTILITSLITCLLLSLFAWKVTHRSLVETVINSPHNPIWNYPFPAVTICNFNQISQSKTYETIKHLQTPSEIPTEQLAQDFRDLIQLLAIGNSKIVPHWKLIRLQSILDKNNITAEHMLQNLTPSCEDMLKRCKWKGENKRCEVLFEQIKTPLGFCCSFNYYPIKQRLISRPYRTLVNKTLKPRRTTGCGYKTGLTVLLENSPEDYFATDVASYGHKVLVHHFSNVPDWNIKSMWLEMKTIMFVSVSPTITTAETKIAKLSIHDRKCLLGMENKLKNFPFYSYHNCLIECRMNIILTLCGCIPFYYYNKNGPFKNNRVCNLRDTTCLLKYKRFFIGSLPGVVSKLWEEDNKLDKCTCLPSCEYCYYPVEFSSTGFTEKYISDNKHFYKGIKIRNHSILTVYFEDLIAPKYTIFMAYYWHNLVALFGGLLSLFTGFGFGTVFELAYFFVIRLALKEVRRKNKFEEK